MKRLNLPTIALLSILLFTACENNGNRSETNYQESAASDKAATREYEDYKVSLTAADGNTSTDPEERVEAQRKLVKRGSIEFETEDPDLTNKSLKAALKKFNGYIASENLKKNNYRTTTELIVKLDARYFDDFLMIVESFVDSFDTKTINVKDVTEEYFDLETRLKTKKELEARYLDLLKKAKTMEEILEVERSIETLRYEIESYEGKLRYLANSISLSTINISYYTTIKKEEPKTAASTFFTKLGDAFKGGFSMVKALVLAVVYVWPIILISLVTIYLVTRRTRKEKKAGS